ncbi:hypothetical protein DOTSEDRAFT_35044 [Dothistroma septosporum NZE10]|uniref:Uncharacterized protein n=1 Tax=Dothistroma septosporum (strain NZE10 / CBS 128990) TaxID=675120 RepID=N1PQN2_DOTSN|nr:hypothetical protein DOTSEDRAFT_35044 [Dothistroma septosporum NZE10]
MARLGKLFMAQQVGLPLVHVLRPCIHLRLISFNFCLSNTLNDDIIDNSSVSRASSGKVMECQARRELKERVFHMLDLSFAPNSKASQVCIARSPSLASPHLGFALRYGLQQQHSTTAHILRPHFSKYHTVMTIDSRDSRLLALPAELRDTICRFVLVADRDIMIPTQGRLPTPPALLSTNRQLGEEARSICSGENVFLFMIARFDASNLIKFCSSAIIRGPLPVQIAAGVFEPRTSSWPGLKMWMHAYYEGLSCPIGVQEQDTRFPKVCAAEQLFEVAGRFMNMVPKPSWEGVAGPQLESIRAALAIVDASGVWTLRGCGLEAKAAGRSCPIAGNGSKA